MTRAEQQYGGLGLTISRRGLLRLGVLVAAGRALTSCSDDESTPYDPGMKPYERRVSWQRYELASEGPDFDWKAIGPDTRDAQSARTKRVVAAAAAADLLQTPLQDQIQGAGILLLARRQEGPTYGADITGFMGDVRIDGEAALRGIALRVGESAGSVTLARKVLVDTRQGYDLASIAGVRAPVFEDTTTWPRELAATSVVSEPTPGW
jgi:hypothetical protein